jgi:hypothetical protein
LAVFSGLLLTRFGTVNKAGTELVYLAQILPLSRRFTKGYNATDSLARRSRSLQLQHRCVVMVAHLQYLGRLIRDEFGDFANCNCLSLVSKCEAPHLRI